MRTFWRALAMVLAGIALGAQAHDADVIYVLVSAPRSEAPTKVVQTVTLTSATLGQLAPVDADGDGVLSQADLDERAASLKAGVWDDMPLTAGGQPCGRSRERALLREGFVELEAVFDCREGELREDFRFLRVLPSNYRVVLGSQFDGERNRAFAQGTLTSVVVPRPAPPGWWSTVAFSHGLEGGLARVFDGVAWASLLAVALSLSRWRQTGWVIGAVLVGLSAGSFLSIPSWAGALGAALASVALAATSRQVPRLSGALVGVCLGCLGGGVGVAGTVGFALGAGVAAGPLLVGGFAVGRLLRRRGSALVLGRWFAAAFALMSAAKVLALG